MIAARRGAHGRAARTWLALAFLAAALVGVGIGAARVGAIDDGALDLATGRRVSATGYVTAVPWRADGRVRVQVQTAAGRVLVEAPEPVPDLPAGRAVLAAGEIRDPAAWEAGWLARLGIRDVLVARRLVRVPGRRGGVAGLLDRVRDRAARALESGTDPAAASLLRGFVLGEDDRIAAETREDFKRSGLAHLLAVSGQNVVLLGLLAAAAMAVLGVSLRARLVWTLVLIAIYVPVAGGSASIQRAGVMGAAAIVAALASRPASRWYALLLAALATLGLNPRATGDVGWQLSFAAVAGILLWASPLREALLRGRRPGGRLRAAFAEGAALTLAATLATAPLMAYHFGAASLTSLPANLFALPAVAPVMWLGMLVAAAGQVDWLPVEPVTALAGLLAAYIAQVARWLGAPGWASTEVEVEGLAALLALYGLLVATVWVATVTARRRRGLTAAASARRRRHAALGLAVLGGALVVVPGIAGHPGSATQRTAGLEVSFLDVGQGDAILLRPADGAPVLVDAGAAGAGAAEALAERGVGELAALVATHPESDHVGGASEVLAGVGARALVYGHGSRALRRQASAAGSEVARIASGDVLRSGSLRLEALWPPRPAGQGGPSADPNDRALVLLARWRDFDLLLTADAEAEDVPLDPGPVDVIKVAHHGSADAGLGALLDRTDPRLAVVSVGSANPFGHPHPATLGALRERGVPVLRTDHDGTVTLAVRNSGWSVRADD